MSLPEPTNVTGKAGERLRALLFGASGSIGGAIAEGLTSKGFDVVGVARSARPDGGPWAHWLRHDPLAHPKKAGVFADHGPYAAVCWAQGANATDSVYTVDSEIHMQLYQANCLYIVETMKVLLNEGLLAPCARMCVVSSIWQNMARQNKLSYCMTKAALQGLVMSASLDLAKDGHVINAVLPGAIDTPMTRANLSIEQLGRITDATYFGQLVRMDDVVAAAVFLCRAEAGFTGQFIAIDNGFSHVRIV